jgi:hypothetical protein
VTRSQGNVIYEIDGKPAVEVLKEYPYIHAIAAGHLQWALYAISMLASALPKELQLTLMRGFGRRGFGLGRGRGIFRLFRIFRVVRFLFVLLFTTALGPIVLVALIAFAGYAYFNSRRER